eukprot:13330133-Ditylum_brightwellii.AAC.1
MAPIEKCVGKKITYDMWKGKVAAWRKSITTLPSGCHLGHFKALIRHFEEDPKKDKGKTIHCFLAITGKSLLQLQNKGDFSTKDYIGDRRDTPQKCSR